MSKTWHLTKPVLSVSDGIYRVSSKVSGQEVWFESTTPLKPVAEAFAVPFFIPALHSGKTIEVESQLDERWLTETKTLLPTLHKWWGYPLESPIRSESSSVPNTNLNHSATVERSGLCFSCGADSFHSLLTHLPSPSDLVFAHGFDIPVDDWRRQMAIQKSLDEVCKARKVRLHIIRTNLRSHRLFRKVKWERTHGGALAALGHLLSDQISQLIIAPSYRYQFEQPWGSSWLLDPHWSSSTIKIEHGDATVGRPEKLLLLSQEPLAQQHLQVCWSLKSDVGNCGECEKCLRTMVTLETENALHRFQTFPRSVTLPELIDRGNIVPKHLHVIWKELRELSPDPQIQSAIDRLLSRSLNNTRWWKRIAG